MNISSRYLIAGRLGLLAGLYCLGASTAVHVATELVALRDAPHRCHHTIADHDALGSVPCSRRT